jgi:hypothetical protein
MKYRIVDARDNLVSEHLYDSERQAYADLKVFEDNCSDVVRPLKVKGVLSAPHLAGERRDWIFTFGFGHTNPETGESLAQRYVTVLDADVNKSREIMYRHFGNKWSMQYPTKEAAGVEKYGLTELHLYGQCSVCRGDQIGARHNHPCE